MLFNAGQHVPIDYLGSDPTYSWIGGHPPQVTPIWAGPLVPSMIMVGVVVFAFEMRRASALLAEGRTAEGVVTKITSRGEGGRGRHQRARYEFADMTGRKWQGSYGPVRVIPAIGTKLTVVYDKDNPKRNERYPMRLVKKSATTNEQR